MIKTQKTKKKDNPTDLEHVGMVSLLDRKAEMSEWTCDLRLYLLTSGCDLDLRP